MKDRSFRIEREFGLVVGSVSVLLGTWWVNRGKFASASFLLLLLGAVLIVLGVLFPRALIYPNKVWMKLAAVLAFVTTRVILAIVFFLIVTPIGVIKRLSGWDPLHRRNAASSSHWHTYSARQQDKRHYEKMY